MRRFLQPRPLGRFMNKPHLFFQLLPSPGAAFELKGPLFIPWQRRDRLALHRLNERRFCALSNCLVLPRLSLRLLDISRRADLERPD